jgi:hypothetical protein
MELNKEFLEKVVEFEYYDSYLSDTDGVKFFTHNDDYGIEIYYYSSGEFECKAWVGEDDVDLDDETLDWLFSYAEESLAEFQEEMYSEERKRQISFDYFMSSNFEKY